MYTTAVIASDMHVIVRIRQKYPQLLSDCHLYFALIKAPLTFSIILY